MISGVLGKANRPLVPLIVGWNRGIQEIVALIDTGFSGEVKIPSKMVEELGLGITHTEQVLLANGEHAYMRASLAFVAMEGDTKEMNVLISEGPAVIGGGLLKLFGYKLVVDYKNDSVALEK